MAHQLNDAERQIIKHSLGLDRAARPYRNRYCATALGGDGRSILEALADRGLMQRGRDAGNGMRWFHVTDAGATAIGAHLPGE